MSLILVEEVDGLELVGETELVRRGATVSLTIPKYCLRELGWKEGDVVRVTLLWTSGDVGVQCGSIVVQKENKERKDSRRDEGKAGAEVLLLEHGSGSGVEVDTFLRKIRRRGYSCYVTLPSDLRNCEGVFVIYLDRRFKRVVLSRD